MESIKGISIKNYKSNIINSISDSKSKKNFALIAMVPSSDFSMIILLV